MAQALIEPHTCGYFESDARGNNSAQTSRYAAERNMSNRLLFVTDPHRIGVEQGTCLGAQI
jgi:hypothetical protein